jgi:hypothetical protein
VLKAEEKKKILLQRYLLLRKVLNERYYCLNTSASVCAAVGSLEYEVVCTTHVVCAAAAAAATCLNVSQPTR